MKFLKTYEQHKVEHLISLKENVEAETETETEETTNVVTEEEETTEETTTEEEVTNENLDAVTVNKEEIQTQRDDISAKIADIESKLNVGIAVGTETESESDTTNETETVETVVGDIRVELESQLENFKKDLSELDKLIG